MTGETKQWSDLGSTREVAVDDAAHRCDRVCWESSKTTDTDWSAQYYSQRAAIAARLATRPKSGSSSLKVDYECNCNPDA